MPTSSTLGTTHTTFAHATAAWLATATWLAITVPSTVAYAAASIATTAIVSATGATE